MSGQKMVESKDQVPFSLVLDGGEVFWWCSNQSCRDRPDKGYFKPTRLIMQNGKPVKGNIIGCPNCGMIYPIKMVPIDVKIPQLDENGFVENDLLVN